MPIDEAMDDSRQEEDLIPLDTSRQGDSWTLVFRRMENCLTLMTRERVAVETILTIRIVTANPEAM